MKPISPVYKDSEELWGVKEVIYAKDQPEYLQLPALKFDDGLVVSKWKLSFVERIKILFTGNIFLGLLTFNKPLQPIKLSLSANEVCSESSQQEQLIRCPFCNGLGIDENDSLVECGKCNGSGSINETEWF